MADIFERLLNNYGPVGQAQVIIKAPYNYIFPSKFHAAANFSF